jgi:pimeloyl-ACP methyl ester carboxylesterase
MDQRNAGKSVGDIQADHGWHTYAGDHLALMDHLSAETFHTLGGCIGSSFCLKLCEMAPARVTAAVLQNPIGVHPVHSTYFPDSFAEWTEEQRAARGGLDDAAVASFGKNMFDRDFVFSVDRDFARHCTTPTLVLPGEDVPHPAATAEELKALLPGTEFLDDWKGPAHMKEQRDTVLAFLAKHTP